jgi:hypothetical protein
MAKFKSKHSFETKQMNEHTYIMPRFLLSLGDARNVYPDRIRRTLFTLGKKEIIQQIDEIMSDLKTNKMNYYDINPGNILFSEGDRLLKLTDFYWCNRKPPKELNINGTYGQDDDKAAEKIKAEILKIVQIPEAEIYSLKKAFINGIGREYNDGSHIAPGITYQLVDVPSLRDIPYYHDNCKEEYELIKANVPEGFKDVVDIGCASAYHLFNLIRDFRFIKAIGYETDPHVVGLLKGIKQIFNVKELNINGKFDDTTRFLTDVTIWMNNHQWINKEIGPERTKQALENVIQQSQVVFFQTAGKESAGTAIVDYLKTKNDIENYIREAGGEPILLTSTTKHGGTRHMFKIICPKEEV